MNEPQTPSRRPGRAKKDEAEEQITDTVTGGAPADGGDHAPVELEAGLEHRRARQNGPHREDLDLYQSDRPIEWDYDEESELEPDYDEESEFEPDYDEDSDFGPGEGPHSRPGHGPHLS
ncbi:hypothetical protein, partial [Mycobacterium kyorinense]|uniref:hypothetical protein n=1 Tax=Mycobacterium kyorinense TaxID=487514 RepID=UPI0007049796